MAGAITAMQKAIQLDPNRADSYLNMALLQARGEQWEAAEANYKKAVALDPKSSNNLVALGNFYQLRGRFPEAEQQFRQAIQAAPTEPEPRASLARLFQAENKFSQAEEVLRQAKTDLAGNSDGYRMLGDFYYATNHIDQAVAEYTTLYHDHPKDPAVKKLYIELLIQKDRLDEARKLDDEILKATPGDVEGLIYKGQIETRSGQASAAINTLQSVLKNEPTNSNAHHYMGMAYDLAGNLSQAEAEWREAVRLSPGRTDSHLELARAAIRRGDASALSLEADQIISQKPEYPDGYLLRAIADIDRKQFASADDYLKRALQRAPDSAAVYVQIGNLRAAQNNPADAQKAFQQALDLDPNSADALGGVLNGYLLQKQPDKALAVASAHLAKYSNNTGFHIILGRLLFEQKKDLAAAEAEFRKAAEIDKNNTEALLSLGMVQEAQGKTDDALSTYLDGARNNPNEPRFNLLAGSIYERKQNWDKAKQVYQRVLDLQPDNPVAANDLAYVMLQQGGNVDLALAMAQTARRQLPNNPNSADTLGWAYYHKGVYDSAINLFKEAVKKDPENATYNYHLGLAYARNGQANQARQQLERVLKIKPDYADAEKLRQAMAEGKG
jgi:tetratricopeptide (TPR) repeat protein